MKKQPSVRWFVLSLVVTSVLGVMVGCLTETTAPGGGTGTIRTLHTPDLVGSAGLTNFGCCADLAVTYFLCPTGAVKGTMITITDETSNVSGTCSSMQCNTEFYLSATSNGPIYKVVLTVRNDLGLNPGQAYDWNGMLTIPTTTAVGHYYLVDWCDNNLLGGECGNTNNNNKISNAFWVH